VLITIVSAVQQHLDRLGAGETSLTQDQVQSLGALDALLAATAKALDNVTLALADCFHIHRHRVGLHAIVGGSPGQVGYPRTGDHRLGGRAALVDAGTAQVLAFNEGCLPTSVGQDCR
jgi:hypothetical protein